MIDTNDIRERLRNYNVSDEELFALCDEIDRLRGKKQMPHGKMVRVKVVVVVSQDGGWWAQGAHDRDMQPEDMMTFFEPGDAKYWLTAELPVPEETEVEAEVENA